MIWFAKDSQRYESVCFAAVLGRELITIRSLKTDCYCSGKVNESLIEEENERNCYYPVCQSSTTCILTNSVTRAPQNRNTL